MYLLQRERRSSVFMVRPGSRRPAPRPTRRPTPAPHRGPARAPRALRLCGDQTRRLLPAASRFLPQTPDRGGAWSHRRFETRSRLVLDQDAGRGVAGPRGRGPHAADAVRGRELGRERSAPRVGVCLAPLTYYREEIRAVSGGVVPGVAEGRA